MKYTVFIIGDSFADLEDPCTDCVRFDCVSEEDMQTLMRLAVANGYDVVVREYEGQVGEDGEDNTTGG